MQIVYLKNLFVHKDKFYKGIREYPFKLRYGKHEKKFNHAIYKNDSELSKENWEVGKKGGNPKVTWKILKECSAYNPESKRCLLRVSEKLQNTTEIIFYTKEVK